MGSYLSVEEVIIKTGKSCRMCNQQKVLGPDKEAPERMILHTGGAPGCRGYIIGWPLKFTSDLCYYHQKKKEGLFDTSEHYELIRIKNSARRLP